MKMCIQVSKQNTIRILEKGRMKKTYLGISIETDKDKLLSKQIRKIIKRLLL